MPTITFNQREMEVAEGTICTLGYSKARRQSYLVLGFITPDEQEEFRGAEEPDTFARLWDDGVYSVSSVSAEKLHIPAADQPWTSLCSSTGDPLLTIH